ncbi:MAG: ATP-binding protein, partial [Candidatus Berkelbacteria bacterium]|nr:ATP-binding protein [Candidatus Berkelbacteria bacterium]
MAKDKIKKTEPSYEAKDIYVLEGLEPVRKRPGMYIGSTGPEGLHHLIWECVDNSLDEAMAGYAKNISVVLLPQNRVEQADDGRGIPVEKHPQTKKSALETVMTTLHAGGKFGSEAYKISGGLHGVGVSVVCALSKWMRAEVCRGGIKYSQEYIKGKPKSGVQKEGACRQTGTTVSFEPDPEIFSEIKFDLKKITNHLRQQAYLTKGVRIEVNDKREKPENPYTFYFEGGLASYVKYLTRGVATKQPNVYYGIGEKNDIVVEAAFQFTEEYECLEESFANNINTGEGGTHLTGFRGALTRTLNDYARKNNILKESEDNLTGEDVREGFTGVVSIKIREPQFEGQTKAKLGNPEAKPAVEAVVSETLSDFLERNPQDARAIIEKCLLSLKARKAAKAARETVLRKGVLEGLALPGKLADCTSRIPEESEIYIVEGESAGGCFFSGTRVALADGRSLSFKELVAENRKGKKNYSYTIKEDGRIGISLIKDPRKTKKNVKVIKIVLDNNEEIVCTPDHFFMLKNGCYKKAESLNTQDSLMPLYRKHSKIEGRMKIEGYEMIYEQKDHKWIYTHVLADKQNLTYGNYFIEQGNTIHHIDFNKLNNNPENIVRMKKMDHFLYHTKFLEKTIHRKDIKEKVKKIHQLTEYREKIRKIMTTPEMRLMLSKRAKRQWQNEEYKQYMGEKFLDFYRKNKDYQEKNNRLLYENQKEYWSKTENRNRWSERVKEYFKKYPEKREELSLLATKQWQNQDLLKWRSQKTQEQWTAEFRIKRKKAYNKTYLEKALKLMKETLGQRGEFFKSKYAKERLRKNDKSLLKYETICQRFFENSEE